MNIPGLRSPYDRVGGLVHFGRMLDKIRLHAAGKLPLDYHANLGGGFDGQCCRFLGVEYPQLVERVRDGDSDEEILDWCFVSGRRPGEEEIGMFNDSLRKRGWRDHLTPRLVQRLQEAGLAHRIDIQTFFDFIDADEGREPKRD